MTSVKSEPVQNPATQIRRTYQAPRLTEYGDVRHLTQGGTAGGTEVGNNNSMFMV